MTQITEQERFDTNDALQLANKLRINVYKDDGFPDCDLLLKLVQFQQAARQTQVFPQDAVEAVTKAILFEDTGSTEDWESNTNLGIAAIKAHGVMDAEYWAELHKLRTEVKRSDGTPWQTVAMQERMECSRLRSTLAAAPKSPYVDNQDTKDALLYRNLKKAHVAKELGVATKEQLQEIELFLLSARYEACSIVGGS